MQNELPEWCSDETWMSAKAASVLIFDQLLDEGRIAVISMDARDRAAIPIARALVAAERRGIERAARHLGALARATPLGHEQPTRGASTYNWMTHCAAAIRQLGETT